jgi:hypothetical protein
MEKGFMKTSQKKQLYRALLNVIYKKHYCIKTHPIVEDRIVFHWFVHSNKEKMEVNIMGFLENQLRRKNQWQIKN